MDHSQITEHKITEQPQTSIVTEQPQSATEVLEEQPMKRRRTESSPKLASESEEDVIDLTQD